MENQNEGNHYMPKNDWQNADNANNEESTLMPGTAGNISSPNHETTGSGYMASDRQDDPGNAGANNTDDEDTDDDTLEDDDLENDDDSDDDDDSLHKNDWGDVDPQHDGTSSNEPSFPGSAI